jgi:hypothetical protein
MAGMGMGFIASSPITPTGQLVRYLRFQRLNGGTDYMNFTRLEAWQGQKNKYV